MSTPIRRMAITTGTEKFHSQAEAAVNGGGWERVRDMSFDDQRTELRNITNQAQRRGQPIWWHPEQKLLRVDLSHTASFVFESVAA
ncbi:hypothetical protein ACXZ66_02220 [Corynebacterium sp. S7]